MCVYYRRNNATSPMNFPLTVQVHAAVVFVATSTLKLWFIQVYYISWHVHTNPVYEIYMRTACRSWQNNSEQTSRVISISFINLINHTNYSGNMKVFSLCIFKTPFPKITFSIFRIKKKNLNTFFTQKMCF